jgi:hypothetical protein
MITRPSLFSYSYSRAYLLTFKIAREHAPLVFSCYPSKIALSEDFGNFRAFYLKNALFQYVCCLTMTLHYHRAAARCNTNTIE